MSPGTAIMIGLTVAGITVNPDPDAAVDNLELETGDDLLLQDGFFLLLES